MAKNVFKPTEVMYQSQKLVIEPPRMTSDEPEELGAVGDAYSGPTVEDLCREADEFRRAWEEEKAQLIASAQAEAERITKEAEGLAFDEVNRKTSQAQKIRQEAEDEAKRVLADARTKAEAIESETMESISQAEREGHEKGYREGHEKGCREGHEKGYEAGGDEVRRLVERLHTIISRAIDKRAEIIEGSETQVINLVLLIAKKVIKVISENQENVVINNVIQALRKLKSRGDVVIRANFSDLELTSSHVDDFMKMVENVKSITVLEDSAVDRGGCIIETDFGQIDARISSQLHEIEEKIVELAPIRQDLG